MADQAPKRAGRLALAAALATALAVPAEGLRQVAYRDPPGVLTACYGHTGKDVQAGVVYSLEQCSKWLTNDMGAAISAVDRCAPGLPEPVLAAFGDAVFNMGPTIACDTKNSTAARYLQQYSATTYRDAKADALILTAACNQLPRWDNARIAGVLVRLPGLTKRRAAERDVCLKGLP
ncbi:lysozyme [Massilia forsythiae]|uniref:Lysozyme n=1 Tax=Massilia forsythiae TaxID=2728020 RepID=A0A7Z2W197_9BURK|nr:lysozyme [Massilia forsythiae]QJE03034.1 lysozyme [Massilia forsythiae]